MWHGSWLLLFCVLSGVDAIYHMYLSGQHNLVPDEHMVADVTHVALAFMRSEQFNKPGCTEWPLFTTIDDVRSSFPNTTKVMVAIGGWGDTRGFEIAASTKEGRAQFASNVRAMVDATGADGADIDWEYPGGNGEDYKKTPNTEKAWEIEAYVELLTEIRSTLGPDLLLSAAVPGLPRDMIAFTRDTVPRIAEVVDFLNIMTYDLMNRRDNATKHHAGISASEVAVDAYLAHGLPPAKANLGFAFYVKWFRTKPGVDCAKTPVGCETPLMEDPATGEDLGQTGAFSWHDKVPLELESSFRKALRHGKYDSEGGGHYFWDAEEARFWTWETEDSITKKYDAIVEQKGLAGAFAWGLGEDAPRWNHLQALSSRVEKHAQRTSGDSLRPESFGKEEL